MSLPRDRRYFFSQPLQPLRPGWNKKYKVGIKNKVPYIFYSNLIFFIPTLYLLFQPYIFYSNPCSRSSPLFFFPTLYFLFQPQFIDTLYFLFQPYIFYSNWLGGGSLF